MLCLCNVKKGNYGTAVCMQLKIFSDSIIYVSIALPQPARQTIAMSKLGIAVPGIVVEDNDELLAECPRSHMQRAQLNADQS